MAGSGIKSFTSTVLTSSDVNNYLMQQSVMVFANATARTTAFTTAGVTASEGMVSYLTDNNRCDVYDGANWQPIPIGAWQTWSPTISGVTVSGTWAAANYVQIGKTVHFYARFNLTSAITGTGLTITLPVTAAASNFQPATAVSTVTGTLYPLVGRFNSTTQVTFYAQNISTTYLRLSTIGAAVPATWASGDNFTISGTYEIA